MFDRVEVTIKSGDGGDGAISFRREKYVPFGGPDGGDGGDGGNVIIAADATVSGLGRLRYKKYYRAANGEHGMGKKRHGKRGESLVLAVPVGTVILQGTQIGGSAVIADLGQPGQRVIVARGGRGGRGNARFATATDQAPRTAERGAAGEEKSMILELRLIADAGIIGYPNAGKSTLLAAASAAKPKIAGYPFTTLEPVLGVVEVGVQSFVLAEIPGLISGAHLGRGLGHDFLRHVTRTRVLVHLIDGTSPSPTEDMKKVNAELALYDSTLADKRQLVAVNKLDIPEVRSRLSEIRDELAAAGVKASFISAATGEGVPELMAAVMGVLGKVPQMETSPAPKKVFRPQPKARRRKIGILGGTFDPVHNGHLAVAEEVRARLKLSRVVFVPAGVPWMRANAPVAAVEHRREMVRLAISDRPYFELSTVDIDRPGPSYTVDTLTELQSRFGVGAELYFILGWGSLAELPRWREPSRLLKLCRLVAVPRPGYPPPDLKSLEAAIPGISKRLVLLDKPEVDVSATEIRERVRKGISIKHLVPEAVEKYIKEHRLYLTK